MVELLIKVGEKGQVLIPKILRDEFGILPGQHAILKETGEGVLLKSAHQNPIELFETTANQVRAKKRKIKSLENQYEARLRRAGIKI